MSTFGSITYKKRKQTQQPKKPKTMNTFLFILLFHFVNGICDNCPPHRQYNGGNVRGNKPCGHGNQPPCAVPIDKNISCILIAGILIGIYKLKTKTI